MSSKLDEMANRPPARRVVQFRCNARYYGECINGTGRTMIVCRDKRCRGEEAQIFHVWDNMTGMRLADIPITQEEHDHVVGRNR